MHDNGKMKREPNPSDSDDEYSPALFGFSSQELAEADGAVQTLFDLAGNPLVQAATRLRARSEGQEGPSTPTLPKYSKVNQSPVISPVASPLSRPPLTATMSMYMTCPLVSVEPKKHGSVWKYYVIFSLPRSRGGGQAYGPGIYSEWAAVRAIVNGVSAAAYKGFNAFNQAVAAWNFAVQNSIFFVPPWQMLPQADLASAPLSSHPLPWSSASGNRIQYPNPSILLGTPQPPPVARAPPLLPSTPKRKQTTTSQAVYYVVVKGTFPGVYNNIRRASKAAGVDLVTSKNNQGILVEVFDGQEQAEEFFQKAHADGLVEELDD